MDKKKIMAIIIFIFFGFFMFTYANPSENIYKDTTNDEIKDAADNEVKEDTTEVDASSNKSNNTNKSSSNKNANETNQVSTVELPTITLGNNIYEMEVFDSIPEFTATTSGNGEITLSVTNDINPNKIGTYTVTFTATNENGNTVTETHKFEVKDTTKPVITLNGEEKVIVRKDNSYTDKGATATDNYDGNLTSQIVTENGVDTSKKGTYTVTYNVSDSSGNKADEVTRTVIIVDADNLEEKIADGNKILDDLKDSELSDELKDLLEDLENALENGQDAFDNTGSSQEEIDEKTKEIEDLIEKIKNLKFTIKFIDYDDTVISENTYEYGSTVVVPTNPTRSNTDTEEYTFNGWDREITTVSGDKIYKATYKVAYKITFVDYDGNTLQSNFVMAGESVTTPTSIPETITVNGKIKVFIAWNGTAYKNVTAAATITPVYGNGASTYAYILDSIYYQPTDGSGLSSNYYSNALVDASGNKKQVSININSITEEQATSIANGKNTLIAVGSEAIQNLLTSSTKEQLDAIMAGTDSKGSYKIEWYVLKYLSDGWHLDGYKVYDTTTISLSLSTITNGTSNNYKLAFAFNNAVKINYIKIDNAEVTVSNNNSSTFNGVNYDGANYYITTSKTSYSLVVNYTESYAKRTYTKTYSVNNGTITEVTN